VWAADNAPSHNAWWESVYDKFYPTDECLAVREDIKYVRTLDQKHSTVLAHFYLGSQLLDGLCLNRNTAQAKEAFQYAAERGDAYSAIFLAQLYFMEEGTDGPKADEWGERARYSMVKLPDPAEIKQILINRFEGTVLSPHLEEAFAWFKGIQSQSPDAFYQIGMNVLKNNTYLESKVLACRWFYEAEIQGHAGARFQLGRQLALGDGVKVAKRQAFWALETSTNVDKNVDAYLLAAQLLQKGDVFEKNLPNAYFALLKAQTMGADVSEQLKTLEHRLSDTERQRTKSWAAYEPSTLHLSRDLPQFSQPPCTYSLR
jgi:TPR repeat protein